MFHVLNLIERVAVQAAKAFQSMKFDGHRMAPDVREKPERVAKQLRLQSGR